MKPSPLHRHGRPIRYSDSPVPRGADYVCVRSEVFQSLGTAPPRCVVAGIIERGAHEIRLNTSYVPVSANAGTTRFIRISSPCRIPAAARMYMNGANTADMVAMTRFTIVLSRAFRTSTGYLESRSGDQKVASDGLRRTCRRRPGPPLSTTLMTPGISETIFLASGRSSFNTIRNRVAHLATFETFPFPPTASRISLASLG